MKPKAAACPTPLPTPTEDLVASLEAVRAEAAATTAQLRAMQALTDTALSHLELDDLLREMLGRVSVVMGVDNVAILLLDADGRALTVRAGRGLLEEAASGMQILVGQGPSGRIAASREPLIVDDTSAFAADHPIPLTTLRAIVGVPLLVKDLDEDPMAGRMASRLVGVLHVGTVTPRRFTQADVELLQHAADRIALAIDRARLYAAEQDARRQATERAERLHAILETMAEGVALYDAAGHPVQMNRAYRALHAVQLAPEYESLPTGDHVRLLDMRDATTGAPLPIEGTPVARALRGEMVTGPSGDIRVRALDGQELEVNSSAVPLRDGGGRIAGAVLVVRDVTERNRLERERAAARADELAAREANRCLEAFMATAAHDLRSPLTATIGFLDLAERAFEQLAAMAGETSPALTRQVAGVRTRLDDANQSTARLSRLLALLFDTAALRAGKLELHRTPGDLAGLVREQVAALRVAAPERTIRLHAPASGAPLPVEADADRVGQVLTNYVTNALKYSASDRPVDIDIVARGKWARVAVRDQGPGIPPAEQGRVWELFHRAPGTTTQGKSQGVAAGGSLGLGLYISRAIITAHGGRVGVKSAVGAGSTFWFTLPLSGSLPGELGVAVL